MNAAIIFPSDQISCNTGLDRIIGVSDPLWHRTCSTASPPYTDGRVSDELDELLMAASQQYEQSSQTYEIYCTEEKLSGGISASRRWTARQSSGCKAIGQTWIWSTSNREEYPGCKWVARTDEDATKQWVGSKHLAWMGYSQAGAAAKRWKLRVRIGQSIDNTVLRSTVLSMDRDISPRWALLLWTIGYQGLWLKWEKWVVSVTPLIAYTNFVVGCKESSEYVLCVCNCQPTVKRLESLVLGWPLS